MVIQKEPKKTVSRLRKARLVVVGREEGAAEKNVLSAVPSAICGHPMPPVNEFNTGYLKEKKHDPL